MEAGRKTDTAFLNPAFPKWSPATCRDGAPDYERRYSQVHRAAKPLDFCPHLVITSPLAAAPELIRPSAAWDTNSLVGMPADGITTSACMCGRVIQSSGPLRYAIVDGHERARQPRTLLSAAVECRAEPRIAAVHVLPQPPGSHTLPYHCRNAALCITAKLIIEWQSWVIRVRGVPGRSSVYVRSTAESRRSF
jgi:hypothetical protein